MTTAKFGGELSDTPSSGAAAVRLSRFADRAAHDSATSPALPGRYPPHPPTKGASLETFLHLYRTVGTAREIDRVELDLVRRGLAFFHVAGAGHEAAACLARHLTPDDWLHGVPIDRRTCIAHREPMLGNAHPTFNAR